MLLHPGPEQLFKSINQHFTWNNLHCNANSLVKLRRTCQFYNGQRKNYGILPVPKQHDQPPWTTIAVDLIGPWIIPQPPSQLPTNSEPTKLNVLTIIDLATCLMELVAIPNKETLPVAHTLDRAWFSRYPRPVECIHNNRSEFVGIEFQEMLQSYGVKSKLTTVHNPQANGILECTHQVIGNLLHSTRLMSQDLSMLNAQQELLALVTWAINSTFSHYTSSNAWTTRISA